jgi:hypothetical protein
MFRLGWSRSIIVAALLSVAAPALAIDHNEDAPDPDALTALYEQMMPRLRHTFQQARRLVDPHWLVRFHPATSVVGDRERGRLLFGIQMKPSKGVHIRHPKLAWTLPEVARALRNAAADVRAAYPGGADLQVGDLSRRHGGRFKPHFTHRAGFDVDLRYYLKGVAPGDHTRHFVGEDKLDCARTWAFIDSLIAQDAVSLIYMDYRLQRQLYRYARKTLGRSKAELEPILSMPKARRRKAALVQHARNHFSHLHVRLKAPLARFFGRLYTLAEATELQRAIDLRMTGSFDYVVRRGDTLGKIAEKHHVGLKDLRRWNRMGRRTRIKPGKVLKIRVRRDG